MASFVFGLYHFQRDRMTFCRPQVKDRLEIHPCTCDWRRKERRKTFKLEEAQRRISKPHIPLEKADWLLCVRHFWALHRHIACWCNESAFQLYLCHPPHVYLWDSMPTLLSRTLTVKELNFPVQEETPCIAVKPLRGQSGLCLACSKITSSICASNFKGGEILRVLEVWLSLKDSGQLGAPLFWQDSSADQQETATSFSDSLESSVWEKACVFCPVQLGMCMMSLRATSSWALSEPTFPHSYPNTVMDVQMQAAALLTLHLVRLLRWDANSS